MESTELEFIEVKDFDWDRYTRNSENSKSTVGSAECCICGKHIAHERQTKMLHAIMGSINIYLHPKHEFEFPRPGTDEGAGDMGMWPIGPDCLRAHPELREYVHHYVHTKGK